jgi:hypothetical protein
MDCLTPPPEGAARSSAEKYDLWLRLVANLVGRSEARNDFENSNRNFGHWLIQTSRFYIGLLTIGILFSVYKSADFIYRFIHASKLPGSSVSALVQITVLMVLIYLMYLRRPSFSLPEFSQSPHDIARTGIWQFWYTFLGLLLFWTLLYLDLLVGDGFSVGGFAVPSSLSNLCCYLKNFFNNICTLNIFICYAILRHKTVNIRFPLHWWWLIGLGILLTFSGLEYGAHVLALSNNKSAWKALEDGFGWLGAAAASVGLALLTEQLGKPEIAAPIPLVTFLYSYAGIQLTWPFIIKTATAIGIEPIQLISPLIALLGKCVLTLMFLWSSEVGRLTFCNLQTRERLNQMDANRENFLKELRAETVTGF